MNYNFRSRGTIRLKKPPLGMELIEPPIKLLPFCSNKATQSDWFIPLAARVTDFFFLVRCIEVSVSAQLDARSICLINAAASSQRNTEMNSRHLRVAHTAPYITVADRCARII